MLNSEHQQAQISQTHPLLWNTLYSERRGFIPSRIVAHVYLIEPARIHLFNSLYIFFCTGVWTAFVQPKLTLSEMRMLNRGSFLGSACGCFSTVVSGGATGLRRVTIRLPWHFERGRCGGHVEKERCHVCQEFKYRSQASRLWQPEKHLCVRTAEL